MKRNNFTIVVFLEDRAGVKAGAEVGMDRARAAHYLKLGVVKLKSSDEPAQKTVEPVKVEATPTEAEEAPIVAPSKKKKK